MAGGSILKNYPRVLRVEHKDSLALAPSTRGKEMNKRKDKLDCSNNHQLIRGSGKVISRVSRMNRSLSRGLTGWLETRTRVIMVLSLTNNLHSLRPRNKK